LRVLPTPGMSRIMSRACPLARSAAPPAGPVVRFGYAGASRGARYSIRQTFTSDGPREVRISANARVPQDRLELPPGQIVWVDMPAVG
jgi:hypothetical protein